MKHKYNIVIRESSTDFGGIENQVIRIHKSLFNNYNIKPILITSKTSKFYYRCIEEGFLAFSYPFRGNIIDMYKAILSIEKIIKKYNIEIIVSHSELESFITRILKFRNSTLFVLARVHTYINRSKISRFRKFIYHKIDKFTSYYIDHYLSISKLVYNELITDTNINKSKVTVIPNMSQYMGPPDKLINTKNVRFNPKIAMIANFLPLKGHILIVKVLSILRKEAGLDLYCRFIGGENTSDDDCNSSNYMDYIRNYSLRLGIYDLVEFYGFTNDIYKAIVNIPVIVLPSYTEGIPNSILEGLSLRKLIVASDVGGIPEIIDNAKNGFLFNKGDLPQLKELLHNIFTTPSCEFNEIRENGYKKWKSQYSEEVIINKYWNTLNGE